MALTTHMSDISGFKEFLNCETYEKGNKVKYYYITFFANFLLSRNIYAVYVYFPLYVFRRSPAEYITILHTTLSFLVPIPVQ